MSKALDLPVPSLGFAPILYHPLWDCRDGAEGRTLPQSSPWDSAATLGRNASPGSSQGAGLLPLSACPAAPPTSASISSGTCLGNGKASALLNGLELPRQPLGLLPLPSAPHRLPQANPSLSHAFRARPLPQHSLETASLTPMGTRCQTAAPIAPDPKTLEVFPIFWGLCSLCHCVGHC